MSRLWSLRRWWIAALVVAWSALLARDAFQASKTWSTHPVPRLVQAMPALADLPAGLTIPRTQARLDLVSVVAADIDADGDLDVVAAGADLELIVWTNDGSGHLERLEPRHDRGLRPEAPAPTVERESTPTLVLVQSGPVPLGIDRSSCVNPQGLPGCLPTDASRRPISPTAQSYSSRAPPAVFL